MRLIIQGFGHGKYKKTLEKLEIISIVVLILCSIGTYEFGRENEAESFSVKELFRESMEEALVDQFFPVMVCGVRKEQTAAKDFFLEKLVAYAMPFYAYAATAEEVLLAEGREDTGEDDNGAGINDTRREAYIIEDVPEDMLSLLQAENGFTDAGDLNFTKNESKILEINWADYETTEDFIKAFYTVDRVTEATPELFEIETLLGMDMTMKQSNDVPQILIYHTHSQEAFADSAPGDVDATIVGAGELLTKLLTEEYGYNVIHHTGEYDVPSRDYAYSKSLPALEKILEENPTIEVVIDLHRDGVAESTHLVTDLNGVPTAKMMFFNGLSRTKKNGNIGYLENKNLQENLAFSFQMQMVANEYYPGLTRKNYLNGYRYNMHLRGKSLLVELGAQTNTVEEIRNAIGPLAHMLDMVLSGENT